MQDPKEILKKLGKGKEDKDETREGEELPTGYPEPLRKYRLFVEGYNISIEEPYFWILHYMRWFHSFSQIDKIPMYSLLLRTLLFLVHLSRD